MIEILSLSLYFRQRKTKENVWYRRNKGRNERNIIIDFLTLELKFDWFFMVLEWGCPVVYFLYFSQFHNSFFFSFNCVVFHFHCFSITFRFLFPYNLSFLSVCFLFSYSYQLLFPTISFWKPFSLFLIFLSFSMLSFLSIFFFFFVFLLLLSSLSASSFFALFVVFASSFSLFSLYSLSRWLRFLFVFLFFFASVRFRVLISTSDSFSDNFSSFSKYVMNYLRVP